MNGQRPMSEHHVADFRAAQRICAELDWSSASSPAGGSAFEIRSAASLWVVFGLLAQPREQSRPRSGGIRTLPAPDAHLVLIDRLGRSWRVRWQRHAGNPYPVLTAVSGERNEVLTAEVWIAEHGPASVKCQCATGTHERVSDGPVGAELEHGVIRPQTPWQIGA